MVWIFKSNDYKKEVALTANELVLDYKKEAYCGFNKFLSDVFLLINALSGYGSFDLKFLGLRYINQFDDDEINKNLVKYFNSDLLNLEVLKNLENNDENLVQIFTKLNFRKENYLLTLQYGLFNPKFPDYEVNKEFILDFDCVIKDIDSIDDIKSNLIKMNKLIFSKFEYSISSELVSLMKNKEIK
ncbi:TIGR04255 family protein [Methanobrevibacter intestini]|uniref:TIGR04255 family protein n=1 Tax=Methanobrevibacter intestini TaxID=2911853 RepID=UPI003D024733